jgi:hypothetical protein
MVGTSCLLVNISSVSGHRKNTAQCHCQLTCLSQPNCLVSPGTPALFMPATSALVLLKWIFAFRNLLLIDIYIQNPNQALLIEKNEQLTKSPVFVEENKSFKFN